MPGILYRKYRLALLFVVGLVGFTSGIYIASYISGYNEKDEQGDAPIYRDDSAEGNPSGAFGEFQYLLLFSEEVLQDEIKKQIEIESMEMGVLEDASTGTRFVVNREREVDGARFYLASTERGGAIVDVSVVVVTTIPSDTTKEELFTSLTRYFKVPPQLSFEGAHEFSFSYDGLYLPGGWAVEYVWEPESTYIETRSMGLAGDGTLEEGQEVVFISCRIFMELSISQERSCFYPH